MKASQIPTVGTPVAPESRSLNENDRVGPYHLRRYIHRGAFGEVWVGHHEFMGSYCAVKVVRAGAAAAIEVSGVRTYMGLAREHAGLVPIAEFNHIPGVCYYYTMPLADDVHGRTVVRSAAEYDPMTLDRYREIHKPLSVDRVLAVLRNLLPSLQALHEAGLVHRDIKPANVIRVEGVWKLCDVGLLVRRDQAVGVCGTPWYMAPEGAGDKRSDLYALGRTAFLLATDYAQTDIEHFLTGQLHLPGTDDRRDALRAAIARACATAPADRYQDAAEMLAALGPLVRAVRFTLVVNEPYATFTPVKLRQLITACRSEGFDISDSPLVEPGSVRVTFDLTPEEAERFEALVQRGSFARWNVTATEWAAPALAAMKRAAGRAERPPTGPGAIQPAVPPVALATDEPNADSTRPNELSDDSDYDFNETQGADETDDVNFLLNGETDDINFQLDVAPITMGFAAHDAPAMIEPSKHDRSHPTQSFLAEIFLQPGQSVPGRPAWALVKEIGRGGFCTVWQVKHEWLRHDNKIELAAVKFCTHPEARTQLVAHEKRVIVRVMRHASDHPHIVPLLDYDLTGEVPWLMYDYVEGGDLVAALIAWRDLPLARRLGCVVLALHGISRGLAHVHTLDPPIVHRDLKPANILMSREVPRIADFGIGGSALSADAHGSDYPQSDASIPLPAMLQAMGTMRYAPPEQFLGSPPSPRDDVYALGVLAFQMVVNDLKSNPGTDAAEVLSEFRIPSELISLIVRSVAMDPLRRPETAEEWEATLEPWIPKRLKSDE